MIHWMIYLLSGWMLVGLGEVPTGLVGLDFGDPALDCSGRGRLCRIERIEATRAGLPDWVESVGQFYLDSTGTAVYRGWLTAKGREEPFLDTIRIDWSKRRSGQAWGVSRQGAVIYLSEPQTVH